MNCRKPFIFATWGIGLAIFLAGCQAVERPARTIPQWDKDTCGAYRFRKFVGHVRDDATREAIYRRVGKHPMRWIVPGEDILADFNSGRINVALDENGIIASIGCY